MTAPDSVTDNDAIAILRTVAQARLSPEAAASLPSGLREALAAALDIASASSTTESPASEAALARSALAVLAADPDHSEPIRIIAAQAATGTPLAAPRYMDGTAIAVTAAALAVLQTSVKWKLNSEKKWSIEITKKSSNDGTLKLLVERLLALLPK